MKDDFAVIFCLFLSLFFGEVVRGGHHGFFEWVYMYSRVLIAQKGLCYMHAIK
jgi:hypothetical protein